MNRKNSSENNFRPKMADPKSSNINFQGPTIKRPTNDFLNEKYFGFRSKFDDMIDPDLKMNVTDSIFEDGSFSSSTSSFQSTVIWDKMGPDTKIIDNDYPPVVMAAAPTRSMDGIDKLANHFSSTRVKSKAIVLKKVEVVTFDRDPRNHKVRHFSNEKEEASVRTVSYSRKLCQIEEQKGNPKNEHPNDHLHSFSSKNNGKRRTHSIKLTRNSRVLTRNVKFAPINVNDGRRFHSVKDTTKEKEFYRRQLEDEGDFFDLDSDDIARRYAENKKGNKRTLITRVSKGIRSTKKKFFRIFSK